MPSADTHKEEKRDRERSRDRRPGMRDPLRNAGPLSGMGRPPMMGKGVGKGYASTAFAGLGMHPMHQGGGGHGGPPRREKLDRSRACPFLLRVFHKIGGHHDLEAFAVRGKEPVDDELQVYTWPDVTLRELADLVKDVAPEARSPTSKLTFRLIYPDKAGKNVMTELGTVSAQNRGTDDGKTLSSSKFQTGDLLDLAIYV
eukprot:gnl/TRDRNA2_/TRDRNA2_67413_c0_seq1.p1 gnl/TRDRNA2_/TRDRNA2_67413_c0~~gnl/TRDRNA2_/TRDRNA2_67413_c0_seq1.p1  ORF type:complete len:200 (-),score=30.39 gnl/TRDRNA2_/TRDRNA2_67413_c0_seq1:77-676(-)